MSVGLGIHTVEQTAYLIVVQTTMHGWGFRARSASGKSCY